ncbi:MAG: hypothetical protein KatS3mg104_1828 [Phycisphaerae bacterium]|nr:MAG: hypothetical protein KatS3mg104_1828 [Phycisphaerae bacterium]
MKKRIVCWVGGLGMVLSGVGCRDTTPPPPYSSIPPTGTYTTLRGTTPKPLPTPDESRDYRPMFQDTPLVTQVPPEQPEFVSAYQSVGRPRIALFVNRTYGGEASVPPTTPPEQARQQVGPGAVELPPPARIDYDAMENILTDWFAAGGKVTLVSAKLSESQIRATAKGDYEPLKELSDKQKVDVLIFVRASETRQSPQGVAVRLVAEAVNTAGGESIGRVVVDSPPFLEKRVINEYTRFMARKLMKDMTDTWQNAPVDALPVEKPSTQPQ